VHANAEEARSVLKMKPFDGYGDVTPAESPAASRSYAHVHAAQHRAWQQGVSHSQPG